MRCTMSKTLSVTADCRRSGNGAMRWSVPRAGVLGLAAIVHCLGCTGSVGATSGPGRGHGNRINPDTPGGETPTIGPDGGVVDPGAPAEPAPTFMRRLTNAEYMQTLADLVGEPAGLDKRVGLPEDPRSRGFDND